jgi:hypothetical protein
MLARFRVSAHAADRVFFANSGKRQRHLASLLSVPQQFIPAASAPQRMVRYR